MPNIAYKYEIYPTKEQALFFSKSFGCCRFIWNQILHDKIEHYKETGEMLHNKPAQYKCDYPWLKEVDSLALTNVQLNLEKAYRDFFKNPKKFGFPKFKSKKCSKKSYTTNNQNGTIEAYKDGIKLPKIGVIKAKIHRIAPEIYKLKSATVSQTSDGRYFCSVLYEYEINIMPVTKENLSVIGLDYKSDGLYMDSDGICCDMPKFYRKTEKKLAKAQRRLNRKTEGSSNYKKQQLVVNCIHRKIANQRKDFLHKKSNEITNQHDLVCTESLDMKALSNKGFHNGKSTLDNGYGMFLNMLSYKQERKGHHFIKIDKFYPSSQLCSCCNHRQPMPLYVRTYKCPNCGMVTNRDENAAVNIRNEGYRLFLEQIA